MHSEIPYKYGSGPASTLVALVNPIMGRGLHAALRSGCSKRYLLQYVALDGLFKIGKPREVCGFHSITHTQGCMGYAVQSANMTLRNARLISLKRQHVMSLWSVDQQLQGEHR